MYFSKTVYDPELGEINLRKQAGIRNIRLTVHPRRGIAVTIPWYLRYTDGIRFAQSRKEWILKTAERQKKRIDQAKREGRGMPVIRDGVTIRTIHQEIIIRRSPQTTLFSIEESSERTISSYGRPASKRRGTISQTTSILTTEQIRSLGGPAVRSPYLEGSSACNSISACSITYPYEWGAAIAEGSTEEKMIMENLIRILRKEAKSFLPVRLDELATAYGFSYKGVAIKNNLTNWGSCSSKGNINLNLHLVRLSTQLCDFIILHELCHLRHMDHSKSFHELFSSICETHFKDLESDGRLLSSGAEIERYLSRQLRKYYLW